MPWWLVWVLLVLGAIALLIWVGLKLWRSFRALLVEVEAAQAVLERLETRMAELDELAGTARPIVAEITADAERREELRSVRREVRQGRRARKLARYDRTAAQWDAITGDQPRPGSESAR